MGIRKAGAAWNIPTWPMSCYRLTPTSGHAISKSLEPTSTRPYHTYHLTRTYDTGLHVSLKWPLLIPWNKPQCPNLDSKRKACQPPLCLPIGMTPTAGCLILSPPQGSYMRESYTWQRATFNTPIDGTLTKLGWAHQWGRARELALVILLEDTLLPLTPTRVIAFLRQLVN